MPKIVNNHEGSALMKDPAQAEKSAYRHGKSSEKPITVKFRKGFNDQSINAVEFAKWQKAVEWLLWQFTGVPGNSIIPKGRLGYHPPGERSGKNTGDRKRGCVYT